MVRNLRLLRAVIANHNHGRLLEFFWHLYVSELDVPALLYNFWVYETLLAQGTSYLSSGVDIVTLSVHWMSTASYIYRAAINRVLDVFQANWTVLLEALFDTLMVILHRDVKAAIALIAVKGFIFPAQTANSTFFTMENTLLFSVVVVKRANGAVILRKILFALDTSG